jgi:hypothetical protein
LVWRKGFNDWKIITETELKEFILKDIPPLLTGEKVNNNIIWLLPRK